MRFVDNKVEDLKIDIVEAQGIINATKEVTHTYTNSVGEQKSYTAIEYVYSSSARRDAMQAIQRANGCFTHGIY